MTPENFVAWLSGYLDLNTHLPEFEKTLKEKIEVLSALDFCYYLNGYFECTAEKQTKVNLIIQDHLKLVLSKITPKRASKTLTELFEEYERGRNTPYTPYKIPVYADPLDSRPSPFFIKPIVTC